MVDVLVLGVELGVLDDREKASRKKDEYRSTWSICCETKPQRRKLRLQRK